ncbi:MAG: ATP-dependent zinc metalloprotease FtsH [Candidatus Omnitrophica bacterium]|nr:ATP-dependent zinc metalloprotease FtsH [Candidatus Omnitrophota bacterium]MCM8806936.1 ATP-dependent zinc metalloprotease FtsH [Candidatus Omnitrophota bacterium]
MENKEKKNNLNFLKGITWLIIGLIFITFLTKFSEYERKINLIYSDFIKEVKRGNIEGVVTIKKGIIYGELKDGRKFFTYAGEDPELNKILIENNVSFKYEPGSWIGELIPYLAPALIFFFLFYLLIRQANLERNRVMSFAKSSPVFPNPKNKITFQDVAGCEEAKEELKEIIEFLKNPKKFQKLGGKIPKGVLLIGPPGTGKTLLAKAVAGEANVPFLSMSGSDFVEMFVGVGAARVRDLFRQAKKFSPCIVFIDEIDAVGRQRFAGLGGGHDEREQTLNQLLVEMDGFQTDEGIIVMAATNRPDVLDPALTRPGRFDRTVVVTLPDVKAREQILKVHTRNKPLDSSVDLSLIARATPGLSGADLANIVNEAALLAARKGKEKIDMSDFEEAKDKVLMGVERKSLYISEEEKRIIAYHEAGHTLVQKSLPEVYPVHKVTIIPRGQALGITHVLPDKDRFLESDTYYKNSLAALLAGRATEEIVFGKKFTGSENDLRIATEIAKKMVCEWGMSENLGPVSFRQHEAVFLGRDLVQQREFSEETSREIDREIRRILEEAENRAKEIIMKNRDKLDILANALLEKETLTSEEIDKILGIKKGDENGFEKDRKGNGTDN